jgi:hypothetical protein
MLSQRYRKKPVEVDAAPVQDVLRAAQHHWSDLPDWIRAAYMAGTLLFLPDAVRITTPEGPARADRDDWIVRTAQGDLHPVKADAFAATYEPAPAPATPAPGGTQPETD